MAKTKINVGDVFKKSGKFFTVDRIFRGYAYLHRAYRDGKKMYEQVPLAHLSTLRNTYVKVDV
jgi:hypothetical protein